MKLYELASLSIKGIKNRGSRFWFTVLGMAVALGVILFLVSLGFGLQNLLLEQITTEESLLTLDIASPDPEIIPLTLETLKEIAEIQGVERIAPQMVIISQISFLELDSQTILNAVDPDFFSLAGLAPNRGSFFTEKEQRKIVINEAVAELFHLSPGQIMDKELEIALLIPLEERAGMEIEIIEISGTFKVSAIVSQPGMPSQVYVPMGILEAEQDKFQEYDLIKVKVGQENDLQQVREELLSKGFLVSALSETIEEANRIFRVVQIVLGIFGVFALIVAAIGLINTMTITLLERTNEIGIMRSIGATSRNILLIFLAESTITGIVGGFMGIGLGIFFAETFNFFLNILARFLGGQPVSLFVYPGWFLVFILLLSSIVGFIAGIWPAKRASKLNPLEALRYK